MPEGNNTLVQLVGLYINDWRCHLCIRLTGFAMPLEDAVKFAGAGKEYDGVSHICHLRCLKTKAVEKGRNKLLKKIDVLHQCRTFAEIFDIVNQVEGDTDGLGPMYVYDVALRIGASKLLFPDRVYLQRGAREGARNLGLAYTSQTIALADLPLELRRRLTAYEIEDFLCIFANPIKNLKTK